MRKKVPEDAAIHEGCVNHKRRQELERDFQEGELQEGVVG